MVQSASGASKALAALEHLGVVAQRYIAKPYLINGLKFDIRIYVLVLSCDPLRVFLYDQGLVRFCTEKYEQPTDANLNTTHMHLCLLYTSPSPRDGLLSRMPSSA